MYLRHIALILSLAALPSFAGAEGIGGTELPPQVPYLNTREDFFMGNGYAGGGGSGDGTWNFLVGPDYTCPNYLKSEEIRLVMDGTEETLAMDVHRARQTGIFYGITTNGDLKVTLIDYAILDEPCVARMVRTENLSRRNRHTVSVRAYVEPV